MATRIINLLLFTIGILSLNACYYDKKEDLFIGLSSCDTTEITFVDVQDIFEPSCAYAGCHAGPSPAFGIDLSTYEASLNVDTLQLMGSVRHESGYIAMPQGQPKLSDCQINTLQAWINQGRKP